MRVKFFTILVSIFIFGSWASASLNISNNIVSQGASQLWNYYYDTQWSCPHNPQNSFCAMLSNERRQYLKISSSCRQAILIYAKAARPLPSGKKNQIPKWSRLQFILLSHQNKLQQGLIKQLNDRRDVLDKNLPNELPIKQIVLNYLNGITSDVRTGSYGSCASKINQVLFTLREGEIK